MALRTAGHSGRAVEWAFGLSTAAGGQPAFGFQTREPQVQTGRPAGQFPWLLAYSPYHNIRAGVRYPPTLIMTADTDDRVAPGMARKFAARLQAEASGGPFLIRVETRAGHGAGKPVAKVIEEDADILAFLLHAVNARR